MKKVCVVTATRAEYGLLRGIIKKIIEHEELDLCLVVTGTHLSKAFGYTVEEIEADRFPIAERIPILMEGDTPETVGKTMGMAMISFADMFQRQKPDMLLVLGDRYELISICSAAMVAGIPIAHISGGEITEGAIDDAVRHCVTKMSTLHFPACETYRKRIIQLGEEPERVFNYGDVGVECLMKSKFMTRDELERSLGINLQPNYICMTYHPVTTEYEDMQMQLTEVLAAVESFSQYQFIITKANADAGGGYINRTLDEFVAKHTNCFLYDSLGIKRYTSLVKYSAMVLGNSSSGIIEAPVLGVPTVNIGNRQKGRLMADSIICCSASRAEIIEAIRYGLSAGFKEKARLVHSVYDGGDTTNKIVNEMAKYLQTNGIKKSKAFYDVVF